VWIWAMVDGYFSIERRNQRLGLGGT
jgi:hypothetical protein